MLFLIFLPPSWLSEVFGWIKAQLSFAVIRAKFVAKGIIIILCMLSWRSGTGIDDGVRFPAVMPVDFKKFNEILFVMYVTFGISHR